MSQPFLTVSAAALRAARVSLTAAEAVACVVLVGDTLDWSLDAPDPTRVVLRGDGRIDVTPVSDRTPARVETYARLLHRLLPDAVQDAPAGVPGALRLAVARGLGVLDVPPFVSAREFRSAIDRFMTDSPEHLIVGVMLRWAEAMGSQSDERSPERRLNGPRVDVLRRMLREADLERYALLREGAAERRSAAGPRWAPTFDQRASASLAGGHGRARVAGAGTLRSFEPSPVARPGRVSGLGEASHFNRRSSRVVAASVVLVAIGLAGAAALREMPIEIRPASPSPDSTPPPVASRPAPDAQPRGARPSEAAPAAPRASTAARSDSRSATRKPPAEPQSTAATAGSIGGRRATRARAVEDRVVPSRGVHGIEGSTAGSLGMSTGFQLANVLDGSRQAANVSLSPDGTRVVFDSDREGVRGVYVADRNGGNVRRVSGPGYAAGGAWTPDGRSLALLRAEPDLPDVLNLWLLDLGSGRERRLTSHRFGEISPASWLPDGRRLCYGQADRLYVMDTVGGASRSYESPVAGRRVTAVAAAPDGRHIVFQVAEDGAWLLDLHDGSVRRVLDDPTVQRFVWSPAGEAVAYYSDGAEQWKVWVLDRAPVGSPSTQ